jgi:type I restriction enzyme, S subunit
VNDLPIGWEITTISDITEYLSRGKQPKYVTYSSLPVVNQRAIRWSGIQNEYLKYVDPVQFDQWTPERFIRPGDILWNSTGTGTLGRACLVTQRDIDPPKVVDSHVTILRPIQTAIDPRFLFFWVQSSEVQKKVASLATGATNQIELGRAIIASIRISIAPLNEQKRIADKLDKLFARVDICRNRLDQVSLIIKHLRQSILNAAVSGELTKDWVYTSNPKCWEKLSIGNLLVEKPRNGYSPRAVEFETKTRSLTLTATTSGRFDPTHLKYIDEIIPEDSHLWLEPDDILIQRANTLEYVGVSAIYNGSSKGFIYPDLMMKCRANSKVLTKFLHYLLLSDDVRSYFRANATGTTGNMPKINQQTVLSAPVWLPSIDEQQEIINCVEIFSTHIDRLEDCYKRSWTLVEQVMPALLDMTFRGELVPQDPDDEPASVLLERMHAAKATQSIELKKVTISRRSTMTKLSKESVKEVISQLTNDSFSFDELRTEISGDYDSLKDILFTLLGEANPSIRQIFDRDSGTIRFIKEGA